ncbi:dicarboxylate/amino acid:cation symporter [Dysgonomonas sp. HGC4]|uniref:dicarboxylate/amino acid:cation symporter n=1 Tax=Dysgonomonas sp. HGC4 TaxID=1658009 RepID=UPI00068290EB|nr:cation:dicarboxylase symporter family transporter [Dysgonomonas sp. HGC4]MBD8348735.1 cation:dicarboxylase symporter family transporter [Dysgonomonas sp. HGC4]
MAISSESKSNNNLLFYYIIIALTLGVIVGQCVHSFCSLKTIVLVSENIKLLGTIFIRLIQMIVAPLVFCTIIVGISKMGDMKMVGRVGGKAMLWFISASLISLTIGLVWINILRPGDTATLDLSNTANATDLIANSQKLTLAEFVNHFIPKSLFEALAHNEILQILVFAVIFGVALASFGEKGAPVTKVLDIISHVILKIVGYIMWIAPIAVFGTITAAVSSHGLSIFKLYAHFLLAFVIGMISLWIVLILIGYLILGKRVFALIKAIKSPLLIAFSTTSSEAVFPKLIDELEKFGCNPKIVSFILPLGYSFNLDGSMMYMTFASIFIAQLYGVEMDLSTQIIMLLVLMLTSKGIAGVPRASLIIIVATCAMFGIPPEGVALLIPIDHFCDMARSMTNVLGNGLATTVVSKWEKGLDPQSS